MKHTKRIVSWMLCLAMVLSLMPTVFAAPSTDNTELTGTVIDVTDYGADPSGCNDSVIAVQKALEAAKEIEGPKTLFFPQGEYHFWPDKATVERVWISNSTTPSSTTNEENTIRTIAILMRDIDDLTLEGDGSTLLFHGKMLSFMAQGCENLTIRNLTYDFVTPAVIDITVESVNGNEAIIFMPDVFNYEIVNGNNMVFYGETSPYTGEVYWSLSGHPYDQINEMNTGETYRKIDGAKTIFGNCTSIEDLGGMRFKFTYSSTPACKAGYNVHIKQTVRDNPSMLLWESENILLQDIRAMHMHSFGIVGQLSKDITVDSVEVVADERKGTLSAAAADMMQMSGCGGTITVKNCHYVNPGDDPINIHGTFLQIEKVLAPNKIVVRYMERETYGFPNYYVGDTVDLVSRNTLNTVQTYTVTEVENPDPNDYTKEEHKTITLTLDGDLPAGINASNCSGYVMENVTYTPNVHITDCVFEESPVRGVLCTTRGKVVIENSVFRNMNMHSIFISDDANGWYESGYCRDVTIRNNIFELCNQSPIDFGPVVHNPDKNDPLHKNVLIEGNTFLLKNTSAITMNGVENVVIRDNTFLPAEGEVELELTADSDTISVGQSTGISVQATAAKHSAGLFSFSTCKNVTIEGNHYGEGMNTKVSSSNMADAIKIVEDEASLGKDNYITRALTDAVISIVGANDKFDASYSAGTITAKAANPGGSNFYAVLETADGRVFESNWITVKAVEGDQAALEITASETCLTEEGQTLELSVSTDEEVVWTAADPEGGETSAVTVDADGVVTAVSNGVAEITATTASGLSADLIITVSIPGEAQAFTVERPVDGRIKEVTATSITYYPSHKNGFCDNVNNAESVITIPIGTPDDFEATVKLTGTTVSTYEEVGFGILQDLDNYVSVTTKQHLGTMLYYEVDTDFDEGLRTGKIKSPAYLRITKEGNTYTGYYRYSEADQWTKIASKDLSYSGELKLAMWAANRSSGVAGDYIWSDLTINGEPVQFLADNHAPAASDAAVSLGAEAVDVSYTFDDPDGHAQGQSAIYWYAAAEENGTYRRLVGKTGESLALSSVAGNQYVKALVVPVDTFGTPGEPIWSDSVKLPAKEGGADYVYEGPSINADLRYVGLFDADFNELALSPEFDPDTLRYMASAAITTESVTLDASLFNANATMTVTVNDEVVAEGVSAVNEEITLLSGFNYIYLDVLAEDGETVKTYRIVVVRPGYEDGTLSELKINGKTVEGFDPETLTYQVILDEPGEVTIEAKANNHRARLMVSDGHTVETETGSATYSVEPGTNTLIAAVRSESYGTYNYYKVLVKVPGLATTELNSLTFAGAKMRGDNTGYTSNPYVTVTADAVDVGAVITVSCNGAEYESVDGFVSGNVPLLPGENTVTITVTSGEETVTHTYTVERVTDIYLSDIDYEPSSFVGYGSIMRDLETDGMPLRLTDENGNAVPYEKGIGAHAASEIVYDIAGQGFEAFQAYVGVDHCQYELDYDSPASVTFKVYLNDQSGEPVFNSGEMTEKDAQKFVDIPLTAEDTKLILVIDKGANNYNDHADWADAKLVAPKSTELPVVGVKLDQVKAAMAPGEELTLTATVIPATAVNQNVAWSSSDESVATVADGVVTAVAEGEAVITVTTEEGGFTAKCTITVMDPADEELIAAKAEAAEELAEYFANVDVCENQADKLDAILDEAIAAVEAAKSVEEVAEAVADAKAAADALACLASAFTDVNLGSWYHDPIDFVLANGMMTGDKEGTFRPDVNISRAQVAQILYNMAEDKTYEASKTFSDVKDGQWFYDAVMWAAANGFVLGDDGADTFRPDAPITRQELVVIIWRYMGKQAPANAELTFADAAEAESWAVEAIAWASENEFVKGLGDNKFAPKANASRAQMTQILMNIFG